LAYQLPAIGTCTFLSEQTSRQQSVSITFVSNKSAPATSQTNRLQLKVVLLLWLWWIERNGVTEGEAYENYH
jgi:hypothetical protein